MRTSTLGGPDELGDCAAPKGSKPWAVFVRNELNSVLREAEGSSDTAKVYFHAIRETEAWKVLDDAKGQPFMSFELFCTHRRPQGLGYEIGHIERIIHERSEREVAGAIRAAQASGPHGNLPGEMNSRNRVDVVNPAPTKGGNSQSYLASRLKRDRPDIAARVEAGEFKSMRAAAVEAGIIKVKPPLEIALAAYNKLSESDKESFRNTIQP
jgi:hypothetical protein